MITAQDFYHINKNQKNILPEIPANLQTDEDITNWILSSAMPYWGWIELDIDFDLSVWQQEAEYSTRYLVDHRATETHSQWRSCCIHGLGVDITGTNDTADIDEYHWTELSELTPQIKKFWLDFPFEKLVRVRFMELGPYGHIDPHNDTPDGVFDYTTHIIPINIAIVHPENCYMSIKNKGIVPWLSGKIILVNITNDHSVINFSNSTRLHMIGHGYIGHRKTEFSKLLATSYKKQFKEQQ